MSPWERRERGGFYYTRSRKEGGRVIREYVGGGVLGEIAALEDEYERRRRGEEAAFWKEERERLEELVAPVEELCEEAEVLVRAALIAAGYRRHNRGESKGAVWKGQEQRYWSATRLQGARRRRWRGPN